MPRPLPRRCPALTPGLVPTTNTGSTAGAPAPGVGAAGVCATPLDCNASAGLPDAEMKSCGAAAEIGTTAAVALLVAPAGSTAAVLQQLVAASETSPTLLHASCSCSLTSGGEPSGAYEAMDARGKIEAGGTHGQHQMPLGDSKPVQPF